LSKIIWVRKLFGSTISAPNEDIATLISSALHAQVSVFKAGLTWSHARLMVLLNNHKMWVEGNFKVTFFMVIMFWWCGWKIPLSNTEQYSVVIQLKSILFRSKG
jgi:hypothetical protein